MTATPLPADAELKDLIARLRDPEFFSRYGKREDLLETASLLERLSPQVGELAFPEEPTREMQRAYFDVIDANMGRVQTDCRFGRHDNMRIAYKAMRAAAPARLLSSSRSDTGRLREALEEAKKLIGNQPGKKTPPRSLGNRQRSPHRIAPRRIYTRG